MNRKGAKNAKVRKGCIVEADMFHLRLDPPALHSRILLAGIQNSREHKCKKTMWKSRQKKTCQGSLLIID